ncbi:AraC family transcriptional regulator [Bifidobacterium saguini DSM 23967]|uniref:AraC family transcriptional regulator n=2 Tax=Bifidobacterium saguini TaxID=762210 RepID=A0A087DAS6_9BIFI|nr:AraC family transcriptional regulator [Bifidobacterium saguini]KFI92626.1 AraC family transcriptional regulator [Bifidobacterium saguini DSM 23967]QTB91638.1 helix-turn-helix domain-containing protein [Bifidobacterium saguini]
MIAKFNTGEFEFMEPLHNASIRWAEHGYPSELARWHHHDEIEIHLIRQGFGQMMVGDTLLPFIPGQVSMIGRNVPHNWISDIEAGERLNHRDIFCHFSDEQVEALSVQFPETLPFRRLISRSNRVIILRGESRRRVAKIMESMGQHGETDRFVDLMSILAIFAQAPDDEWSMVLNGNYAPNTRFDTTGRINTVISYINEHLGDDITVQDVAKIVVMHPNAFSRFFHAASGMRFSELVTRLRISKACRLLVSTGLSIAQIRKEVGYPNAANFNRSFLKEVGVTPSEYRKQHRD